MLRAAALMWLALALPVRGACALALTLGLDISSSVNPTEYAIQKQGLAAALRDLDVREAILSQDGTVWISVFEWSGVGRQSVIADWALLDTDEAILSLAARISGHLRSYAEFATAIGQAVGFGAGMLKDHPDCARRVIDISGDGVNNDGVDQLYFRRIGALEGITVNGLVIKGSTPDPEPYYRSDVISGPNAFLLVAEGGFEDYPRLIRQKLLREIAPQIEVSRR